MYRAVGDDPSLLIVTTPRQDPVAPTPDQILQFAAAGGCTQTLPNEGGAACLDNNWAATLAQCKFGGSPPAGVTGGTWIKFCGKAATCSWYDFPYCATVDTKLGAATPTCLSDALVKFVDYCDKYPLSDGPDRGFNMYCWAALKSGTLNYNLHAAPRCAPGTTGAPAQAGMSPGLKLGLIGAAVVAGAFLFTRRQ